VAAETERRLFVSRFFATEEHRVAAKVSFDSMMSRSARQLCADAERIWRAGVAAVLPERLIREQVRLDGDLLLVEDEAIDLRGVERIAIVGAGKAAGGMAGALEQVLGPRLLSEKQVTGWVNVPADCVVPTSRVVLHAARPAGVNEPRPEGVEGTRRILEIVSSLRPTDLCFCVLSGGGSALLPAPVPEISLDDKIRMTRLLSAAGANIEQLNTVRRTISLVKGGGLARACNAGRLITLVISDVLGDPLEAIASGPTVVNQSATAFDALAVLKELGLIDKHAVSKVVQYLQRRSESTTQPQPPRTQISHCILGNNASAVDAAGVEAERLGYSHAMISATAPEGPAEDVGRHLASMATAMRHESGPDCLISGGEPTVTLVDESRRGTGGRNQQLALAALAALGACEGIALLAGGTDGEDGPTDAAGAFVTEEIVRSAQSHSLHAPDYLARNDAYNFFRQAGGLFITGATQTNVCDLRVVVVDRAVGAC
jgi:hydroxypyruvate reductase